jgi:hypothetical protein
MAERAETVIEGAQDQSMRTSIEAFRLARQSALRRMLWYVAGAVVAGIALSVVSGSSQSVLLSIVLLILLASAWRRVSSAREQLGRSVLKAMAEREGAQFVPEPFEATVWSNLAPLLSQKVDSFRTRFVNLLRTGTSENPRYQAYDAEIYQRRMRTRGIRNVRFFVGQFYELPRKTRGRGTTVLVPRGHRIGFSVPGPRQLERVVLDDAPIKKVFDVYSTDSAEARQLLSGSKLSEELLQLAKQAHKHQVFTLVEPAVVTVAVDGVTTPRPKAQLRGETAACAQRSVDHLRGVLATGARLGASVS